MVDVIATLRQEGESQFMWRSSATPLHLIVVAGMMSEFLVASFGESFVAYRSRMLGEVARTRVATVRCSLPHVRLIQRCSRS
jgi:hypothetical protein